MDLQSRIKVLHVDDDPNICKVTKMYLERLDQHIQVDFFTNPLDIIDLFMEYDCVISDFKMPRLNGIELSKKIRESSNIPIILYTGQGSEEVAESAFSIGVNDYVRKDLHHTHFNLLINRIKQTVQRNRAESALIESEARYRTLLEYTHDLIQSVLPNGRFEYVNKTWLNTLNYSVEEIRGLTFHDIIDESEHFHCNELFMKVMQGQPLNDVKTIFRTKNGVKIPVKGRVTPRLLDGKIVATHGFFTLEESNPVFQVQLREVAEMSRHR